MKRRQWLLGSASAGALGLAGGALWLQGEPAAVRGQAQWRDTYQWLDQLEVDPSAHTLQGWPLPQVLEHLAQSIEFSLHGYPQLKPDWFRASLGRLAASAFNRQGWMQHDLQAPIPGAAPLSATDTAPALQRLRAAIRQFEQHRAAMQPHFAYGPLTHADYGRAHRMHIADHAQWIRFSTA